MTRFKYLIVGGGVAADAATQGIRSADAGGSIGLLGEEAFPPYDRPPLSSGLWNGVRPSRIWRDTEARDVTLLCGRRAVTLDASEHCVVDSQGERYTYDRMLLATGATPKRHPQGGAVPVYFRTLEDYRMLRELADRRRRFIVVGGGHLGPQLAAALSQRGKSVTMVFLESSVCGNILPPALSALLARHFRERGVQMITGRGVAWMRAAGDGVEVGLEDGSRLPADAVVAALGVEPNSQLAERARLNLGDGILVDECMRTSDASIFAAGDVACMTDTAAGRCIRFEHAENARATGLLAGMNMAGRNVEYQPLTHFGSDLFSTSYEAVGDIDPALNSRIEWVEPEKRAVVFYQRGEAMCGVLLWNLPGKLNAARDLIRSPCTLGGDGLREWTREHIGR